MNALLDVRELDKRFGGLHVTRSVSFTLSPGDRVALIGPNGAGKTTLVNLISGVLAPSKGSIWLAGDDVTLRSQAERVRRGMARTFQITTLAANLPVQRQIELALFEREGLTGRAWRSIDAYPDLSAQATDLLDRMGLLAHAGQPAGRLAYGEQRLVEVALALALRPRVLLFDEPMAGVPQGRWPTPALGARHLAGFAGRDAHRTRHGPRVPVCQSHHRAGRGCGARRWIARGDPR